MVAAVKITRLDHTATALHDLAAKSNEAAQVRRLLALAHILEGQSCHAAARQAGMDRQTLRDWVHRYNAEGVPGLRSIRSGGHPASLTDAQMAELKALTIKGPDPEEAKVVRWRCVDLRDEVARRFTVTVTEERSASGCANLICTIQPAPRTRKRTRRRKRTLKKIPRPDPVTRFWPARPPPANQSKYGSATKPEWVRKARMLMFGHRSVHVRPWCAITVTTPYICLVRYAPTEALVRRS